MPPLMPPPAITTVKTFGQWSRPAVPLIFGVRPNSEAMHTSVDFEQAAAIEIADQRRISPDRTRATASGCRSARCRAGPSRRRPS